MNLPKNPSEYVILVVDDNPTNLGVLTDYLWRYDFELITAVDGEDALETAKEARPDLILLDVMMPGIDGFETCRRLKGDAKTQEIPVIFMTALASEDDKVKGFEAGAVDYVTKPIMQREVLARVTTHLRMRDLMQSLQTELADRTEAEEALKESQQKLKEAYALEHERRQLSDTLREVTRIISSSLEQDKVLDLILTHLAQVVKFNRAAITLIENDELVFVSGRSSSGEQGHTHKVPVDRYPLNVDALEAKKPILLPDVREDERWRAAGVSNATRSFINAPLLVHDRPIGLLGVARNDETPYDDDDAQTVSAFASQVAIALENARLMKHMQRVNDELARLNRDKDKFFSIVAHDLKGPFQPLLGNAELLAEMGDKMPPQQVQQMCKAIYLSGKRVLGLLENLLQWSRMQMGRMEYEPEQLDLHPVVQSSVNLLMQSAESKEIELRNLVQGRTPVYADRHMLDTIIRNLINNALKFTASEGQVSIKAQLHRHGLPAESEAPDNGNQSERTCVEVAVVDTGVGIAPGDVDKLFKIDVHHSTSGTAKERGTGLGLIMCQEMVEMNGGRIWVESELGKGTKVKFTVPVIK